jgi:signal transduction histidine kinase
MLEDGLLSIIILLRDESENEQIRVRTQQLEQRAVLGEVTAIFAHEVRNPVNNISTGLQLLAMKFPADDPNQDLLQRLQHDCTRLTHLMESVLSFSRPMEYKLVPSDLGVMFRRMIERWRPRFAKANIETILQIEPDVKLIIGDLRALEQVFTNLLSNSIQAMTSGGVIAIKMANKPSPVDSPEVEITVSDTGPGIPDEIKDHIFEPFVTNNPQGTGLGLAITKRIITAHKGTINVTSFPGGTVFQVTLPGYNNAGGTF